MTSTRPALEPAVQAFLDGIADGPFLSDLPVADGRRAVDAMQQGEFPEPAATVEPITVPGGPTGSVRVFVYRPLGAVGVLPVALYLHGAGWVFGGRGTHDRLVRELTCHADAALVFVEYRRSPEARYPTALEQIYCALRWVAAHGSDHDLDPARIAVAGDSVGGNMSAALALLARQRGGPRLAGQLLFYPVTDASTDTPSYRQFAAGYWLRRDAMRWFWDQYAPDASARVACTASPLRASAAQLAGLPEAMVVTAEADVLRDEGEAYAAKLRAAGVAVTAVRYHGTIHDFVMLNALRETRAAQAATVQGGEFLRTVLWGR